METCGWRGLVATYIVCTHPRLHLPTGWWLFLITCLMRQHGKCQSGYFTPCVLPVWRLNAAVLLLFFNSPGFEPNLGWKCKLWTYMGLALLVRYYIYYILEKLPSSKGPEENIIFRVFSFFSYYVPYLFGSIIFPLTNLSCNYWLISITLTVPCDLRKGVFF